MSSQSNLEPFSSTDSPRPIHLMSLNDALSWADSARTLCEAWINGQISDRQVDQRTNELLEELGNPRILNTGADDAETRSTIGNAEADLVKANKALFALDWAIRDLQSNLGRIGGDDTRIVRSMFFHRAFALIDKTKNGCDRL